MPIARVLAPGGRVALNVWGAMDRRPLYVGLVSGILEFLSPDDRSVFDLAFSLNTAAELRKLAGDADSHAARIRFEHRTTRYSLPSALIAGAMSATRSRGSSYHCRPSDNALLSTTFSDGSLTTWAMQGSRCPWRITS